MVGQIINNYKLISLIGEGGMGTIYLAEHKYLDTRAAIKVLHPHLTRNKEIKERFINEAVVLSKLSNPYIVKLKDFFDYGDNLFLIMEFVNGVPLDKYIKDVNGPVPEHRTKPIITKILDGVNEAHSKGIIHRDIKPSNIMLEPDDTPKILDFGIAKLALSDNKQTMPGSRIGSLIYMSPEQILGKEVTIATDIYSLGILLYEMLTAKNPFDIPDGNEYLINNKIISQDIIPPSSIYPAISRHIEEVFYKAIAKDPVNRFHDCAEFLRAIDDVYFNSKIEHSKPSYTPQPVYTPQPFAQQQQTQIKSSAQIMNEIAGRTAIDTPLQYKNEMPGQKVHDVKNYNRKIMYALSAMFLFLIVLSSLIYALYFRNNDVEIETDVPIKREINIQKQPEKIEVKTNEEPKIKEEVKTQEEENSNSGNSDVKEEEQKPEKKVKKTRTTQRSNNNTNTTPTRKSKTSFE
ncbi:MAG: serine/threonine protein kinase [Ignavibacteriae bacterium]|nr:MAG: serine/threonine protein kinase [Ignavibacteriota bacterium]